VNDLKFPSYVLSLKAQGEQRLFPELRLERDGYGQTVSRWFTERYRKECGIESAKDRMKDFHSFRTTFITYCVHKNLNERKWKRVVGHSMGKSTADKYYIEEFPVKQLYDEVVAKIKLEGLDLTHLANSKFVVK
jgi:hypothetical protein